MSRNRVARYFLVIWPMMMWVLFDIVIMTLFRKHGDRFLPNHVFNVYSVSVAVSLPAIGGLIDCYRTRRLILNSTDSKTIEDALLRMYSTATLHAYVPMLFILALFTMFYRCH
jgi:hypothetical protein